MPHDLQPSSVTNCHTSTLPPCCHTSTPPPPFWAWHLIVWMAQYSAYQTISCLDERYICEAECDAVREWSEVTRPSADCQTTFFRRFKQLEKYLKKVVERSRDSGRRSRDRRLTVKQRFLDVSSNLGKFWKKSLNGHATLVGGHATVGRLSNNVFGCFKQLENFLKKVTERSRDSGRKSRDRRPTVKQRFWMFQAIRKFLEKSHWTVTRQWSEVTRPSDDCQTTFFDVSSN